MGPKKPKLMAKKQKAPTDTEVENYRHDAARRVNIPTAENQSLVPDDGKALKVLRYPRNPDLDPQLVWRGKDKEDGEPLEVAAPPRARSGAGISGYMERWDQFLSQLFA